MKTFFFIFLILSSPAFSITGSGFGPPRPTANLTNFNWTGDSRSIFSDSPFDGRFLDDNRNTYENHYRRLFGEDNHDQELDRVNKSLENYLKILEQSSRLEFLLKSNNSIEDSSIDPQEVQFLKNKKEFLNALELLERGETEAVLEDGTVIPLLKMVIDYAKSNFIYKASE